MAHAKALFVAHRNETEVFEHCFRNELPILIKGPTGCGKSQLVEHMAEKLDRPLIKVACNEDTNAADLLGRFILKGGETIWQDGPVTRAARQGAVLYLDEFAEAREDVVVAVHPLTDHRREIYLDKINETVKAAPGFIFVASYNPGYQKGFKEIKPSTRQRFVGLSMDYLPQDKEAQLLQDLTGIPADVALQLCSLATKIRSKKEFSLKETVSTRLLVHTAKLMATGMNKRRAAHQGIAEALSDDRETVEAMITLIDLAL